MNLVEQQVQRWLSEPLVDEQNKEQLRHMTDQKELQAAFNGLMRFGTAGMRGVRGPGESRMNHYTIRHATQALSAVLADRDAEHKGVVVGYDPRVMAWEFAKETACVFAANGIPVYLFEDLQPTPELSFAIRHLGAVGGVNLTASHNPKEYTGYKAYDDKGCQLCTADADAVLAMMNQIDLFSGVRTMEYDQARSNGLIRLIGAAVDEAYLKEVLAQRLQPALYAQSKLKVIYTPLHGAGYRLVPQVLQRAGFTGFTVVPSQGTPDGNFPTIPRPNPEFEEAFAEAKKIASGADLLVGTDPDADRLGVMVLHEGQYRMMTGNEVGLLLLDYILANTKKGSKPQAAVSTIVSSRMIGPICRHYGTKLALSFTGFRFICEEMEKLEDQYDVLFAFEESCGYLKGNYARDKDGVCAVLMLLEMATDYQRRGMTLIDGVHALRERYGWYGEKTVNLSYDPLEAAGKMAAAMKKLRKSPPAAIGGLKVLDCLDYLTNDTGMEPADVLLYTLEQDNAIAVRPSGTEPKIKYYLLCRSGSEQQTEALMARMTQEMTKLLQA